MPPGPQQPASSEGLSQRVGGHASAQEAPEGGGVQGVKEATFEVFESPRTCWVRLAGDQCGVCYQEGVGVADWLSQRISRASQEKPNTSYKHLVQTPTQIAKNLSLKHLALKAEHPWSGALTL